MQAGTNNIAKNSEALGRHLFVSILYNKRVKLFCFDRVFVRPLPHQQVFRAATGRERGCDTIVFIIPACFARGSERSITEPRSHCWKYIQLRADS